MSDDVLRRGTQPRWRGFGWRRVSRRMALLLAGCAVGLGALGHWLFGVVWGGPDVLGLTELAAVELEDTALTSTGVSSAHVRDALSEVGGDESDELEVAEVRTVGRTVYFEVSDGDGADPACLEVTVYGDASAFDPAYPVASAAGGRCPGG